MTRAVRQSRTAVPAPLAVREKTLGPDHADIAAGLSSLAELYRVQSRYDKAEPCYLRAVATWQKLLGPRADLTCLNNLAEIYRVQGHYTKVEPLALQALAMRERLFGPDHPACR